ncbi:uncharacterized protein LOC115301440 isoform X5 [Suricata suricatta]|uniref:uncharacterized protein LOC115301440 isoform X5 n=1 Tax=Suricata suricatta TaxID=37032 RepID=UPI001155F4A8|nr:uncharacterized protein LOC115301440 isoform X5 [Suricata suricatta]
MTEVRMKGSAWASRGAQGACEPEPREDLRSEQPEAELGSDSSEAWKREVYVPGPPRTWPRCREGRRAPGESGGQGPRLKVGQRARRRAQLVGLRGGNRRLSSPPGPSASSKNVPAPGRPPLKTDVREKADYCQRLEAATRALGSTGRTSCVFQRSLSVRSSPSLSGDASQVTLKQKALQGPQRPEDVPRWT